MVDLVEAPPSPAAVRASRWRLWFALAAVVIVLAAGSITAVAVSFRYLHAAPLSTTGGSRIR